MNEPHNLIYTDCQASIQSVLDLLELFLGKAAEQDAGRAHRDGVAGVVVTSDDSGQVHARSRHVLNKETFDSSMSPHHSIVTKTCNRSGVRLPSSRGTKLTLTPASESTHWSTDSRETPAGMSRFLLEPAAAPAVMAEPARVVPAVRSSPVVTPMMAARGGAGQY